MRTFLSALFILLATTTVHAQQYTLQGELQDGAGKPVIFVPTSLLHPEDSTLAFFGISNAQGRFEIKAVKSGNYILQVAGMGYRTHYAMISVPTANGNDLGKIVLLEKDQNLKDVEVKGEKIPMQIKKDTIEYNAGAFKVKPDAAVEDLLKKLPGVEVDKAGNIKAQGKDVNKILVDGKEFFGDDPKVASKNLPADAISKVQVFDRKSDQAQFTGIDDGERDKTINLMLKDNKKNGYFGDLEAGGGTGDHYKLSGKIYRFKPKSQVAALGMLNNINQFGFSLQDYISFKGGMRGLMDGSGNIGLDFNRNIPVNFGQPVTGLITSGAGGLNYSYELRKNNRFNISYLGNGASKKLDQETNTQNYTENGTFSKNDNSNEHSDDYGHRLYYSWRDDIDSTRQITLHGGAEITNSTTNRNLLSSSAIKNAVLNNLDSRVYDKANGLSTDLTAAYLKRFKSKWSVWKISAGGGLDKTISKTQWNNTSFFPPTSNTVVDNQYQHNDQMQLNYNAATSVVRSLGKGYFLEPEIRAGADIDELSRKQGPLNNDQASIDSLSPDYKRSYKWLRPGISFKRSKEKVQYNVALREEQGWLQSGINKGNDYSSTYSYLLPSAFAQYEYEQNSRLSFFYNTKISAPAARQMLPVTDYSNPTQRITGNPLLQPEYRHTINASWLRFDPFSFTSLMVSVGGRYTHNKVNWSRRINPDLSQDVSFVNVPDNYDLDGSIEYTLPVRKLGINLTIELAEQYNKGMNPVNGIMNDNNSFTHTGKLRFSNREKEKWSWEIGGSADLTNSKYSLQQSLNNTFVHYNGFAEISYRPSDRLYFSLGADVDRYDAKSFSDAVTVPLLKASTSYYFLKAKRGVLTLEGFDLLNKNNSIQRISEMNYLTEQKSSIIGQYFLLSFKYRLSKTGGTNSGPDIDISIKK